MAKILVAILYMAAIIVIGIISAKRIKSADGFATANKNIPFWSNVYSMSSAQIGAGATMGVASLTYAFGVSGISLGVGAALGSVLCGIFFARKIRESEVTTIPELIRKNLGIKIANVISALTIFTVFSVLAAQIRSLGSILLIFIPELTLAHACILMSVIMMIYAVLGGMVATVRTDKLNIMIMVLTVMVFIPIIALTRVGGFEGIVAKIDPKYLDPVNMGLGRMISLMAYFALFGMLSNENFLRICGARNAAEARSATLTSALLIYLPYMLFCSVIGLAGIALIPELSTSDSIIPAMIDQMTGDLTGAFLLAGLLAAVMGTAASVAMVCAVTFSRDVFKRLLPQTDDKGTLLAQRLSLIGFTIAGIFVAIYGSSIVGIMEDVGAPTTAAVVPLLCGIFFWKKLNPTGAICTIIVAVITTLGYYIADRYGYSIPYLSHFLFGLICATITMIVATTVSYKPGEVHNA